MIYGPVPEGEILVMIDAEDFHVVSAIRNTSEGAERVLVKVLGSPTKPFQVGKLWNIDRVRLVRPNHLRHALAMVERVMPKDHASPTDDSHLEIPE